LRQGRYTCEDLLFIQLSSDPTPVHCNSVLGNKQPQGKTGSHQAVCHSRFTYGNMLFIQVCSDPTPVHCITVLCKMQCPHLIGALQDRLAAGLHPCSYTCEDLLFTQVSSDPTPVHCRTFQGKAHCPQLSAAPIDRLAAGLYHCSYTYEDLLFIQVCSDPTPGHRNTDQGKMQSPLHSAALQGLQQACITAITPLKICCLYRCAVTQHRCIATLLRAKCSPHCSSLHP